MLKSDFDALAAGGINALDPEAFKRIDEFGLKNPKFRSAIEKVATGRVNDLSDDEYYGIIDKIGAPERAAKLRKEAEVYGEEARQRIEENERGPIEGFVKGMAQDITVPLASGVVGLGKSAADLAYLLPIGNKPRTLVGDVKQGLKSAQDWVEDQRTFLRKDEIAQSASDMEAARQKAEAEGGSVIAAEVAQSLKNIKRDPAALAEGVLKQAPNIAALMLGGGAAGMAAKGAGATLSGVGKAQTAGAILSGAGLSAADVGGGVTDNILALPDATFDAFPEFTQRVSELTAKGLPEDRARQRAKEEIAVSRGRVGALVGGGLALGTAAAGKLIPGVNTIEKAIGRNLAPTAGVGRLGQVATGVLGEGVGEAIEEGAGAAAQNLLVGGVDPTRSATRGIGEAAVQGALTAGPTAAVFGASGGEFDEAAIADKMASITAQRAHAAAFAEEFANRKENIKYDLERKVALIKEGKIPFKIEDFEKAITRLGLDPAQIETFGSLEQKKQAYLSAAEAELERLKQQEAETGVSATEEPLGIEWDGTIKVPPTERTPTQTWAGRSAPTFQPPSAEELVSEIAKTNPSAAKVAAANRASQDGYFDELTNARPEMIERVTSWRQENPFGQYSDFITQLENEVIESDPAVQKADQQAKESRAKAASVKVATQTADPTQAPPPGVTPEEMRKAMQDGGASIEAEATADQEHARTVRQTKAKQAEEVKAAKLVEKQKKLEAKQKVMAGMIRLKTGEEVDVDALLEEASVAGIRDSAEANIASIRKKLEEKARKESEKVAKASAKKAKAEATTQPTPVEEPQTQPAQTQEAPAPATPTQVEPVAEPTQAEPVQAPTPTNLPKTTLSKELQEKYPYREDLNEAVLAKREQLVQKRDDGFDSDFYRRVRGMEFDELINAVVEMAPNAAMKSIASRISRVASVVAKNTNTSVVWNENNPWADYHGRHNYNLSEKKRELEFVVGASYATVLHELMHYATLNSASGSYLLAKDPALLKQHMDFYNEIKVVYRSVVDFVKGKADEEIESKYSLSKAEILSSFDSDELLTWGLTRERFANLLKDVKIGGKSAWTKFVDAIATFFGVTKSDERTALEEVISLFERTSDIEAAFYGEQINQDQDVVVPEAQPEQPIDYTPFIEEMSKASLKSIANTDTERITAELSRLGKVEHGVKANPPNRARAQVLSRLSALAGAVLPRTYNTYAPSAISAILSFGGFSASNPLTSEDQVVELGRKLEQLSTFTPPKESFIPSPELLRDGRKFKPTSIDRAGDRVALTFGDLSGSVDASTFDELDAPDAVRTVITDGSSAVLKIANPEGTRYLEVSDIEKTATDEGTPVVDPADVEDPAVSKELKSIYSTIDQLIDEDFEKFTSEATAFYSSLSSKAFNLPEAYAKAATRLSKARDQISDLMDAVSISEQEGEIDPQILKDLKKMQKQIPAIQRDTALLSTVTGIFASDKAKMENYPDPDSELHKASGMRVGLLAKQMYPNSFLPPETLSVLAAKAYSEAMGASPLENPGEFKQWMQEQVKSVKLGANHPAFFIAGGLLLARYALPALTSGMLTASAITYAGLQLAKLASKKLGRFGNSERWFIGSTDVDYTDPNTQKTTTIKGKDVLSTLDQAKYLRSEHARQPNLFFRMANKRYGVELLKQAGRVGEHMARTTLGMKGVNRVDSPIYKMNKQIADFLEGKSSSISPELRRIAGDLRSITNHFHGMMQARGIRGLDPSKYYPKAYDSESMRKLMSDKVAYNDYLKSDLIPKVIRTMKDAVNEETRRLAAQAAAQGQVVNIQNLFQAAAENIAKEITSSMSGLSGGSSGDKVTLHTSRHLKERSVPFDVPDTWKLSSGEIVPLRDYDVRRLFSRYIASMARTMAEMDVVDKEMIRRYTNGIPQQAIRDTQANEITKSIATIINNDLMDSTGSVIAHEGTRKALAVAKQITSTLLLAFNPYFVLIRNLALSFPNLFGLVGVKDGMKAIGSMIGAFLFMGRGDAHKKGKIRDVYHPYGMQDGAGFLADIGFRAANLLSIWGQSAIDIAGYNAGYNYAPKLVKQARDEVAGKKTTLVDLSKSRGKIFGKFDEAREMLREAFSEEEAAQIETGKTLTEFQRERIASFIRDKVSVDSRNLNIPAWLGSDLSRGVWQFVATSAAGLGTTMKIIENPKRAFNLAIGMGTAWTTAVLLQYLLASLLGDEDKEEKFGELVEKMGGSASDGLELGMDMAARTGVFGPLNILPDALKATYAEEPVQLRTILTSGAPSFQIAQSLIDMGVSAGKLTRDDYEVQDLRDDLPTRLQKLGEGGNLIGGFVEE